MYNALFPPVSPLRADSPTTWNLFSVVIKSENENGDANARFATTIIDIHQASRLIDFHGSPSWVVTQSHARLVDFRPIGSISLRIGDYQRRLIERTADISPRPFICADC